MGKPVVILADTDEQYLSPLEMKFLEEHGDNIELELITQPEYFMGYFSVPRNADVLLVSEELYSIELQKHNISEIFVLAEQIEEGGTDDLGVTKIFKYTSIKEIYKQVSAASSGIMKDETQKSKETLVLMVYSASGGVGKTTLALGMSACLAQNFQKVLYLNAENINSFQYRMENQVPMPVSVYPELSKGGSDVFNKIRHVIRNEGFDYLPPFGAALPSLNLEISVYEDIIQSARLSKEYDVIVVDTDATFDLHKAEFITKMDKVFMVVNQTGGTVSAMNMLMKNMSCKDNEKYYFICNDFDERRNNALISSDIKPNFMVNEYVKHIEEIENISLKELALIADVQKIAFLVM